MTAVRTRARPQGRDRPAASARSRPSTPSRSRRAPATATRSTARSTRSRAAVRSLPQETTGPRLRVLPRRRVSGRALLGLSAALFFVVLAGSVTIQAQRIEAQHRIDQLDVELLEAQDLHRELRADVAVAESPERIMAAARDLGMVEPGPVLPLVPPAATQEGSPAAAPTIESPDPVEVGAAASDDEKVPAGGG